MADIRRWPTSAILRFRFPLKLLPLFALRVELRFGRLIISVRHRVVEGGGTRTSERWSTLHAVLHSQGEPDYPNRALLDPRMQVRNASYGRPDSQTMLGTPC